ncbi:MAG: MFS transporter [Nocardioidaceae bacterium]
MLAPYRSVLATPGAKRFTAAGLLARTPISTMTLGIVLLVEHLSGSYGFAGTVSAAYMGGAAAASPVLGRFIDRFGQRRVLLPAFAGFASGLLAMMVSLELGWPSLATYAAAAVGGIAYPPVGSCIRARWSCALSGPALHTAFSLEAMVDEMLFILGPVLVTVLAVQVDPSVALLAVLVVAVVGGGLLSGLRATEPPVSTASSLGHRSEPAALGMAVAAHERGSVPRVAVRRHRGGDRCLRSRTWPAPGHRCATGDLGRGQLDRWIHHRRVFAGPHRPGSATGGARRVWRSRWRPCRSSTALR